MALSRGPVGILDSGVGGLAVLRQIRKLMPNQDLWYVADQSHAPYGERSLQQVRDRAVAVSASLVDRGAGVIVVACNSASAAALHHLREVFSETSFVGMEPAVKPAALSSATGIVGVLATEATFQGELFASVVDRHARDVAVIARACPGLAEAIEELPIDDPLLDLMLHAYVDPIIGRNADVLVLGCTHYSFVGDHIARIAGGDVQVIDPAPAIAGRLASVIGAGGGRGELVLETTADPMRFGAQVQRLLGLAVEPRHTTV